MKNAAVYGGVGFLTVVGVGYLLSRASAGGLVELRRAPSPPTPPPAPGATVPAPTGPTRLAEPFALATGGRYIATVSVAFPLSIATSASDIAKEARGLGFTDVGVSKTRPAIPPVRKGDYYVTGSYSDAPRSFPRSNAKGLVTIEDVWRIA